MRKILVFCSSILLSMAMFVSCTGDDDSVPDVVEEGTGEILIDTYVDGVLQEPSSYATVYLDGGYATGAGRYTAGTPATVAAFPNTGYTLQSFEGGPDNMHKGAASYTLIVPEG